MQNRQIRGKETQLLLQPLGALAVGGQQQGEALCSAGSLGNGQAQGGTGQIAPVLFTCRGREKRKTQNGHGRLSSKRCDKVDNCSGVKGRLSVADYPGRGENHGATGAHCSGVDSAA